MKRSGIASAIMLAMNAWMDTSPDLFMRRRGVVLPKHEPSEEEQQRRIQAAAERRAKRNAKHKADMAEGEE